MEEKNVNLKYLKECSDMEEDYSHLIGKKAYKNHNGLFGGIVGIIEESATEISPLCIVLPSGMKLGALPKELIIVEDEELEC